MVCYNMFYLLFSATSVYATWGTMDIVVRTRPMNAPLTLVNTQPHVLMDWVTLCATVYPATVVSSQKKGCTRHVPLAAFH